MAYRCAGANKMIGVPSERFVSARMKAPMHDHADSVFAVRMSMHWILHYRTIVVRRFVY